MSVNPKDAAAQADQRVRLDLLEPVGDRETARALMFGAITKGYGVRNYVKSPVSYRVYIAAMRRHLADLLSGEDVAPDSLVHHLGHVAANCHIILAAIEEDTLIDDRMGEPEQTDCSSCPPDCCDERIEDLECERVRQDFVIGGRKQGRTSITRKELLLMDEPTFSGILEGN